MGETCNVSLLGWGAIGRTIGLALHRGEVLGARLHRVAALADTDDCPVPVVPADELAAGSDIVVEAAGQGALAAFGASYLTAGCRLFVVSAGALVDQSLFDRLVAAGGSRLSVTSGAIGGLDLLAGVRRAGAITELTLTTTKRPDVLVQDWMDDELAAGLRAAEAPVTAFDGAAADAVAKFPQSVNVAATLALAVGSWDLVRVRVVGDPAVTVNRHEVRLVGDAGRYLFTIENHPSPDNPRTSGVVPHAVVRGLADLVGASWRVV
ncbi:MAG: aspartate dehydrogenase domain-containing protein [Actinomycetota bacterium]